MAKDTLLQRVNRLSPLERSAYLSNFPKDLLRSAEKGRPKDMESFLGQNYGFIETILELGEAQESFSPVEHLIRIYDEAEKIGCSVRVRLIGAALRDIATILEQYPDQLASQLYERLLPYQDGESFAKTIRPTYEFWLKPLRRNLFTENDNRIIVRHDNTISNLLLTPDSKRLISICGGKILVTWLEGRKASAKLINDEYNREAYADEGLIKDLAHAWGIVGAVLTLDGQQLYSVSSDGLLILWDITTHLKVDEFNLKKNQPSIHSEVTGMVISHDGRYLYVSDRKGDIRCFSTQEGMKQTAAFCKGTGNTLLQLLYSKHQDMIASLDIKGNILVWWPKTEERRPLSCGNVLLSRINLSPDGNFLLGKSGNEILVIDINTDTEIKCFKHEGHGSAGDPIVMSEDGRFLYVVNDGSLVTFNTQTSEASYIERLHGPLSIYSLIVIPRSQTVLTGDDRGNVRLSNLKKTSKHAKQFIHEPFVDSVAVDIDGKLGISIGFDRQAVWSLDKMTSIGSFKDENSLENSVSGMVQKDNLQLLDGIVFKLENVSNSAFGSILRPCLVKLGTSEVIRIFEPQNSVETIESFHISTTFRNTAFTTKYVKQKTWDNRYLTSRQIYLYWFNEEIQDFEVYCVVPVPYEVVKIAFTYSHNHVLFVSSGSDDSATSKTLDIYDIRSKKVIHRFHKSKSGLDYMQATNDLTRVVASDMNKVLVWDISNRKLINSIELSSSVTSMNVDYSDKYIAITTMDKMLEVWSLKTGEKLAAYYNDEYFKASSVSLNCERIMAGDVTGNVKAFIFET